MVLQNTGFQYSQDWANYDRAKTNEDRLFKTMLNELLFLASEKTKQSQGRPSHTLMDKVFCMCVKAYYKSDLRKTTSILYNLHEQGYINKVPCYKSIDNFYNDASLHKYLDKLILLSSMPLARLETICAMDSTGFSTSKFAVWNDYKWGKQTGKERVWKKAHALLGCKTNTFVSVQVTDNNVGDSSMFHNTINDNLDYFSFDTFVADKAYLSRDIMDFMHRLSIMPYIPFKKNSVRTPRGSKVWAKMFSIFHTDNEEYMKVYNRRSNIETGFHMVKQRFGNHLMTKTDTANINEIKTRFLCHNLCVLIQELYESNIDINFETCVKSVPLCVINEY